MAPSPDAEHDKLTVEARLAVVLASELSAADLRQLIQDLKARAHEGGHVGHNAAQPTFRLGLCSHRVRSRLDRRGGLGRVVAIFVMLVGICVFTLVTGVVSQRFLAAEVEEGRAEVEQELEDDVEAARAQLLREIRVLAERLGEIESSFAQAGR